MEPALKHRLIGAAVLSALAIIFLPMLIVGKDPNQTATRVPLKVPDAPAGNFETKELPLGAPASGVPDGGVVGMDTSHPVPAVASPAASAPVDAASVASPAANPGGAPGTPSSPAANASPASANPPAAAGSPAASGKAPATAPAAGPPVSPATAAVPPAAIPAAAAAASPATTPVPTAPIPAANAGGHYVVSLGTYSNAANAQSLVASLKAKQLPAYAETVTAGGKQATRVRIGPFPQRGDAEAARLKAQQVRSDMPANVVALDAAAPAPEIPAPVAATKPAAPPVAAKPAAAMPASAKPAVPPAPASGKNPAPATLAPAPAAAGRGFAVQVSAFGTENDADALRNKLRTAGFVAYTEKIKAESGTRWRVRVGPEADRDAAEHLRTELSTKMNLSGMVVSYP